MKHRGTKILSLLLSLVLALLVGVMPGMSAWASSPFGLSVGSVDVDLHHLSGEGWIFDPATNTLTLNGARITVNRGIGIDYNGRETLNIVLNGENKVSATEGVGIDCYTTLSISGGGSLTVSGSNYGIGCRGTLEISGGSVDASGDSNAILSMGTITISGGTVTATGSVNGNGILANNTITISNGSVTADGVRGLEATTVTISGGSVTATGRLTAIFGNVKNSIAGTGWSDKAGTNGETAIPVSETARPLTNYMKMVFEKPAGYTVSFDANGGDGTMADVTGVSGSYTLPGCGFDPPEGQSFKAWRMDGTEYAPGAKINIGRNTTFVAVWQAASSGGAVGFGGGDGYSGGYVTGQRAYRASLAPMQGGSAALVLNTGESGEALNVYPQTTVRVVPSPAPGYKLASIVWSLIDGSASYDITQSQTFVMPAMDAVVHVTFAPVG